MKPCSVAPVLAADVWYKLDDLSTKPSITDPPGASDSTVVVLLLVAEDKLIL